MRCPTADETTESRFETIRDADDFESTPLTWKPINGGQMAQAAVTYDTAVRLAGRASMRVDYQFSGKRDYEYIQVTGPVEFSEPGVGFGFWLKRDGLPGALRLRISDSTGETHQVELAGETGSGWQFVAGLLDTHSTAWGGDGNKRIDYPCRLSGIVIDRPYKGFTSTGSLWIDDAVVVRQRKDDADALKVEASENTFGNLYAVGQPVRLRLSGKADRIRWRVRDFFARLVASGEGPAAQTLAQFTLTQCGWYACDIELLRQDTIVSMQRFSCAALPNKTKSVRSHFVGVCTHFGQNRYPLPAMDLMLRYGIDQYRDEVGWSGYERRKGQYELPDHAKMFLQHSARLKMRPLLIFDYGNPLYADGGYPNSSDVIAAFASYAVDLARRTRGTVNMFEVWNEWVGGCGMRNRPGRHDGDAYGRLLKPTYAAVKAAFPDVTVVGIGGEYGSHCADNIVAAIQTAGLKAMDAWSIHPYRYPRSPEESGLVDEVTHIAERVRSTGVTTQAWITEIGYPTHRTTRGSTITQQANHCVRTLALLQSTRLVEKVFWYDLKDDGLDRDYNENNFGLIHHQAFNCAPKPAIVALSAFIRMTNDAAFQELLQRGTIYAVRYRQRDGQELIVAWSTRGTVALPRTGHVSHAFDLMGAALPNDRNIVLSESPVYIRGSAITFPDTR